jgi:Ca2+-binding EF-hand superfamily protein
MSWQTRFNTAKVAEMKDAFDLFDRNGDGTICAQVSGKEAG